MTFSCEACDSGFTLDRQTWTCKSQSMTCSKKPVSCTGPQSVGTGDCTATFSDVRATWVLVSSRYVCSTCTEVEESVTVTVGVDQETLSQQDYSVSAEASGEFLTGSVSASETHSITKKMSYSEEKSQTFTVSAGSTVYFWQMMIFWKIDGKDHSVALDHYAQTSSKDAPCPPSFNSTCVQTFAYQCPVQTEDREDTEDQSHSGLISSVVAGAAGLGVLGGLMYVVKVKWLARVSKAPMDNFSGVDPEVQV